MQGLRVCDSLGKASASNCYFVFMPWQMGAPQHVSHAESSLHSRPVVTMAHTRSPQVVAANLLPVAVSAACTRLAEQKRWTLLAYTASCLETTGRIQSDQLVPKVALANASEDSDQIISGLDCERRLQGQGKCWYIDVLVETALNNSQES